MHSGRPCYRITCKAGESIVADETHLWAAIDRNTASRAERTYTTRELQELFAKPYDHPGYRLSLPEAPTLELPEADLPATPRPAPRLMDTDGSVSHTGPRGQGQCEYSSKDERLARQVLELIRSLGYRASIVVKPDTRSRTGEQWRVRFRSRPDCVPFLLPRKADRCVEAGEQHYTNRRSIVLIEPVAAVSVRCITVDTSDHLFLVGDGFVPTHSSHLAGAGSPEPLVPDLQRAPGLPSTARASLPEVGPVIRSHLTCGATERTAMAGQIK